MLLIYNLMAMEQTEQTAFMGLLNRLEEPWRQLGQGDLEVVVEDLLVDGQGQIYASVDDAPDVTFMLMDVDEATLDRILAGLRDTGVTLPYKAMLTDTNRKWKFGDLVRHVIDEDREVRALNKLQRLISAAAVFMEEDYEPQAWQAFRAAYDDALELLSRVGREEISAELAESTVERFNQSVLQMLGR